MSAKEMFDIKFYERYRQKGGIYVIPVEICQELLIDQEELFEENEELKKQINHSMTLTSRLLVDKCKSLDQQQEFIRYLKDEINFYKNRNSYMVSDIHGNYDLNKIELELLEEIIAKYKKIILDKE